MEEKHIIRSVENAAHTLRSGQAVRVRSKSSEIRIKSVETVGKVSGCSDLIISAKRASYLTGKKLLEPQKISLDKNNIKKIPEIVGLINSAESSEIISSNTLTEIATKEVKAAIKLAKVAELIPALLICAEEIKAEIDCNAIDNFDAVLAKSLTEVCRAPLTLEIAEKAEIAVFRSEFGSKEHFAILIGKPEEAESPLTRIHSACFTGDVLSSLKCDCRNQLQEAVKAMQDAGGGILLYLQQDGRGIGLVNKLRTYSLQAEGMDTIEANENLGFDDDERPYLPAVVMLKKLGFSSIRLLTNNPNKVQVIEKEGIIVQERIAHITDFHEHNEDYMETKFQKMGHLK